MTIAFQKYELENDPTYFSEVRRRYQYIVEFLLGSSTCVGGIEQGLLDLFKETYGGSAFVCRYLKCPRASNGFSSSREREAHETVHVKRLKCADTMCEFYIAGFATKTALQRHNRTYHIRPDDKEVPTFPPSVSRKLQKSRLVDPLDR